MNQAHQKLVIEGVRADGSRISPSDWIERISAPLATFGPARRLLLTASVWPVASISGIILSNKKQTQQKNNNERNHKNNNRFRPIDLIERISATLTTFCPDHQQHYARGVQPKVINGLKCLVVDVLLREEEPAAYEYVLAFAKAIQLRMNHLPASDDGGT